MRTRSVTPPRTAPSTSRRPAPVLNMKHTKPAMLGCAVGAIIMTAVILAAIAKGNSSAQLQQLLDMPWGVVSLVDLYTGFILFSAWIWYREEKPAVAAAWTVAMMTTGFAGGSVYAFLALRSSGSDPRRFWMGKTADSQTESLLGN